MSTQSVLDGICRYFGGDYDPKTHTYRSSPVPGVGVVRRSWAKRDDHADYFRGMGPGARTGSQINIWIPRDRETRFALGGPHGGQKYVIYDVQMACYIRSRTRYAEEAQDDVYALRDALKDWMRRDRELGGACFEAGEHIDGGMGSIGIEYGPPETSTELTKSFFLMSYQALEIVSA